MPFTCSICGEESTRICVQCTKDACLNHVCEKCQRCSDCCECEVVLEEGTHEYAAPAQPAEASRPSLPVEDAPAGDPAE